MTYVSQQEMSYYATSADFCRVFRDEMKSLFLLALTLTADLDSAELAFGLGLKDCTAPREVFKEWARSWARRSVIKNSIRLVSKDTACRDRDAMADCADSSGTCSDFAQLRLPAEIYSLLALPALERMVFVISVCEGYCDHDCALLLGCTREVVTVTRIRSLRRLGGSGKFARERFANPLAIGA